MARVLDDVRSVLGKRPRDVLEQAGAVPRVDGDLDPAMLEVRARLMQAKLPSALVCTATVIAASASCAAAVAAGGWGTVLVCPASVVVSICACRGVIKKISGFDFSQCEMD